MNNLIKIFMKYILFLIIITQVNCSYVMDSIEGAIRQRASFKISVSFENSTNMITVDWPDAESEVSSDAFAGYEIYITEDINDEYANYQVVVARYDIAGNIINSSLSSSTFNTQQINVVYSSSISNIQFNNSNIAVPTEGGVIFIRVGVIDWDKSSSEDRDDDWEPYWSGLTPYYFSTDKEWFYTNKSNLSEISGYKMLEIPAE